jgi:hypothetical protein
MRMCSLAANWRSVSSGVVLAGLARTAMSA